MLRLLLIAFVLLMAAFTDDRRFIWLAAAVVLLVGAMAVINRVIDRPTRDFLYRFKNGLCTHCGYDKRANPSGICPECGQA